MAGGKKRERYLPTTAAGGPGTYKGTNFQSDFAIWTTLKLIRTTISTGAADAQIMLEPRLVGDDDTITAWDVRITPRSECFEAKSNLTAADLVDWLKSVSGAAADNSTDKFTLIYGDGRPSLLKSLDRLSRDAAEASDPLVFTNFATDVGLEGTQRILSILSPNAYTTLRRIHLKQMSRPAIDELINVESELLAGPRKAADLRSFLFERISRCAERRLTVNICQLIAELQNEREIQLTLPPIARLGGMTESEKAIMATLEACSAPVPTSLLLESIDGGSEALKTLIQSGRTKIDGGQCVLKEPHLEYATAGMEIPIARFLESLLASIERAGRESLVRRHSECN